MIDVNLLDYFRQNDFAVEKLENFALYIWRKWFRVAFVTIAFIAVASVPIFLRREINDCVYDVFGMCTIQESAAFGSQIASKGQR